MVAGVIVEMSDEEAAEWLASLPPPDYAGRIKAHRDKALEAGITLNGIRIQTDDVSQQRITGAALAAFLDPNLIVNWKTDAGFVQLTAAQIIGIAQAVRAHVQACFDREAELLDQVAAAEVPEAIDLSQGWPGGAA